MLWFNDENFDAIRAGRIIASWIKVGGTLLSRKDIDNFNTWLLSIGIAEEEAKEISDFATNGKFELEESAKQFLKNLR